jgi:hypothetical protein
MKIETVFSIIISLLMIMIVILIATLMTFSIEERVKKDCLAQGNPEFVSYADVDVLCNFSSVTEVRMLGRNK